LVIAEGGSILLHWMAAYIAIGGPVTLHRVAESIAFSTFILRGEFDPS
jgi:hypothetical protein